MNKELKVFSFNNSNTRVVVVDGEPWIVARDVAEALEYNPDSKVGMLFKHVPEEWKGVKRIDTPGGKQNMLCLSEQGLYFFLGRSDKPKALPYQKWIAREVVPTIRKHGRIADTDDENAIVEDTTLHVVEQGIVSVYRDMRDRVVVNARELHAFLGVGRDFSTWIKERIERYEFVQGEDFEVFPGFGENPQGGRPTTEYILTLDMAKEIAMIENNDKGRQVRKYFIKCESELLHILSQAKAAAEFQLNVLKEQSQQDAHKVSFYDTVTETDDHISINTAAKVLNYKNMGPIKLFVFLKEKKVLMSNRDRYNVPYQKYIDKGLFRFSESCYTDWCGETFVHYKPWVSQKGLAFINRLLLKAGYKPMTKREE